MDPVLEAARKLQDFTISVRRDLHIHPELGFQEFRTSEVVSKELHSLQYVVTEGVAKTGVVGLISGKNPGPCVMLRFDMDALPIQETTGADYASQSPGIMHACGHDGHVAIGLTVARMLKQFQDKLSGSVKLVFQPAEEGLGGAQAMIAEGVLTNPKPDTALGMHLWNDRPAGWVAVKHGDFMAGADFFRIIVTGKGGHGAMPNQTQDPIVAASQIVNALQSIVSRNISPFDSAVISVTLFQSGTTFNVIPGEAILQGTIRTYKGNIRSQVIDRIEKIVRTIADAMGCEARTEFMDGTPTVVNSKPIAEIVQSAVSVIAPDFTLDTEYRSSASEDMAYFLNSITGCFFFLGSAPADEKSRFGHHHPKFEIDESVLPYGAAIMTKSAIQLLNDHKP